MKNALIAIGAVVVVLVAGILTYIPFFPPREICARLAQWDGGGFGWRLNRPMGLAWNDGFLYVADAENGAVKKLRNDGSFVAEWKGFKRPVAVAAAEDAVYVADFLADQVVKLNPHNGTAVARWGEHGNGTGEFDAPSGIAVGAQGFVYVTEFYNHRIQKFTGNGAFVSQWGTNGRWNGQFHYPTDVAAGATGELMVADAYNNRIEVFTADGRYLRKWGGTGYGISGKWGGWFRLAKAVAVDATGDVYVADAFNRRIQKFSPDGRLLGAWGGGTSEEDQALKYASGVAVSRDGSVYVSDFFENRITKLRCR
jgi:DNA-binding beta-propeller fold protein YncE